MSLHTQDTTRSPDEQTVGRRTAHPHLRLRKPHRARSALRTLRQELEALYEELTAALLPDGKARK
jgi:hypothetical protein